MLFLLKEPLSIDPCDLEAGTLVVYAEELASLLLSDQGPCNPSSFLICLGCQEAQC